MLPEAVQVRAMLSVILWVILVVYGVCTKVIDVDLTNATRNQKLNLIRHEVAEPVLWENTLQTANKGFRLLSCTPVKEKMNQVHDIHRSIQVVDSDV